uniref:Uncharacterized protein n=1 Tax=Rhizophora mucronata TaxID=61149 RepID=A0A2P2NB84_RHIMU
MLGSKRWFERGFLQLYKCSVG